jgi:hypothetical protein
LSVFGTSCKTEDTHVGSFGYEYLALDSGRVNIYRFDSISFDDNTGEIDTFNYFLKEEFSGYIIGVSGEKLQILKRFVAKIDTNNWEPRESAFALLKEKTFERIDQNQRRIKLVFPLKSNAIWNGNAYNDLGKTNYSLTTNIQLKNYLGTNFKNVIEVLEANQVNFIETLKEKSVYAKNMGLVYYESTKLSTQSNKTSGYILNLLLISSYH